MKTEKAKITKTKIEQLGIGDKLWDTEVVGFYVHKQKTKTCFYYKYRVGKTQKISNLGQLGSISLDDARNKARQFYSISREGIAPDVFINHEAKKKLAEIKADSYTIADAYRDWEVLIKPQLKKSSLSEWSLYHKYVEPKFGEKMLGEISITDINSFHSSISKPYSANRCIKILKKLFNLALTLEKYNGKQPFRAIKLHKEHKRRRHLTGDEPQRLFNTLEEYKLEGEEQYKAYACVMLYLLTSARKKEWLDTPKHWVDFESRLLKLPDTKNGEPDYKILPSAAIEILKELFAKYPDSYWVFPSPRIIPKYKGDKGRPLENIKKHWLKIKKLSGISDLRLHDLRRSFASFALTSGYNLTQIGEILNHKNIQTTKGYAYLLDSDKRAATDDISEVILARMRGEHLK